MSNHNNGNGNTSGRSQMSTGASRAFGAVVAGAVAFGLFIYPGPLNHHQPTSAPTSNSARQQ